MRVANSCYAFPFGPSKATQRGRGGGRRGPNYCSTDLRLLHIRVITRKLSLSLVSILHFHVGHRTADHICQALILPGLTHSKAKSKDRFQLGLSLSLSLLPARSLPLPIILLLPVPALSFSLMFCCHSGVLCERLN